MQVDAVYDRGDLILGSGLRLADSRFSVRIEVPDDMVVGRQPAAAAPSRDDDPWLRRLAELRREAVAQIATTADDLTDEQAQRLAAFRMRDGA
jgi:hypothetical protein